MHCNRIMTNHYSVPIIVRRESDLIKNRQSQRYTIKHSNNSISSAWLHAIAFQAMVVLQVNSHRWRRGGIGCMYVWNCCYLAKKEYPGKVMWELFFFFFFAVFLRIIFVINFKHLFCLLWDVDTQMKKKLHSLFTSLNEKSIFPTYL